MPGYGYGASLQPKFDCRFSKIMAIRVGCCYVRRATGQCFGPSLFLLFTSEFFSIQEKKLIGYSDDSTLLAVVSSPGVRVAIAESHYHDLGKVSEWCIFWGMKLNASKNKTVMVSRLRTVHPLSPS